MVKLTKTYTIEIPQRITMGDLLKNLFEMCENNDDILDIVCNIKIIEKSVESNDNLNILNNIKTLLHSPELNTKEEIRKENKNIDELFDDDTFSIQ